MAIGFVGRTGPRRTEGRLGEGQAFTDISQQVAIPAQFPVTSVQLLRIVHQDVCKHSDHHRHLVGGQRDKGSPASSRLAPFSKLRSGRSAAEAVECRYIVWLPFDGLGNRMLSMVSGFLTGRVFLVALPPDSADLFCEPFPGTTWLLPLEDFPVANLFGLGHNPEQSYTRLLHSKKIVVDSDPAAKNATAPPVPAYVYLSLGYQLTDRLFFCGEHQLALGKVNWLLLYSDLYFVPSLYPIAGFRDELRRLFPARESASHLLLRYLLHPGNPVWGLVTRYYHSYLAPAARRIGVQIRMAAAGSDTVPADEKYNQILACSRQERIQSETVDDGGDEATTGGGNLTTTSGGGGNNGSSTAILVASLYADYYERLRSRY
ncbi:hypothetical protein C2845_PM03G18600 [Panicum miliaceum]|uniref:Fucosyltransferase n=1 Tax=Panicum miliaceum TaxID=4540 RepID=A0A3L6T6T0_PANMI|nr:hypothetical protein C2845_PM03G18600 [Panicum miliaceum]